MFSLVLLIAMLCVPVNAFSYSFTFLTKKVLPRFLYVYVCQLGMCFISVLRLYNVTVALRYVRVGLSYRWRVCLSVTRW